jgi:hypothetical protein
VLEGHDRADRRATSDDWPQPSPACRDQDWSVVDVCRPGSRPLSGRSERGREARLRLRRTVERFRLCGDHDTGLVNAWAGHRNGSCWPTTSCHGWSMPTTGWGERRDRSHSGCRPNAVRSSRTRLAGPFPWQLSLVSVDFRRRCSPRHSTPSIGSAAARISAERVTPCWRVGPERHPAAMAVETGLPHHVSVETAPGDGPLRRARDTAAQSTRTAGEAIRATKKSAPASPARLLDAGRLTSEVNRFRSSRRTEHEPAATDRRE